MGVGVGVVADAALGGVSAEHVSLEGSAGIQPELAHTESPFPPPGPFPGGTYDEFPFEDDEKAPGPEDRHGRKTDQSSSILAMRP